MQRNEQLFDTSLNYQCCILFVGHDSFYNRPTERKTKRLPAEGYRGSDHCQTSLLLGTLSGTFPRLRFLLNLLRRFILPRLAQDLRNVLRLVQSESKNLLLGNGDVSQEQDEVTECVRMHRLHNSKCQTDGSHRSTCIFLDKLLFF